MARQAVVKARELRSEFRHNYIGTEHLLYGLAAVEEGIASQALAEFRINAPKVKQQIEYMLGKDGGFDEQAKFTPRAQRVFELSIKESKHLGTKTISTEHILLGILREGDGVAMKILAELEVQPGDLAKTIHAMLKGDGNVHQMAGVGRESSDSRASGAQMLEKYAQNLTKAAEDGKLDPVVGRATEVERLLQILSRRTKNNPVLIGEPGVGKTAVAEGLAQAIVRGDVPETLKDKSLYVLDLGSMVAGTQYRGMFEDRLKKVMAEVSKRGDIILFVDEIHTLVGAGSAEGSLDAASILKPMLARGEMQVIGATTLDEYRKYFEKDSALERRFQPVKINEPTIDETVEILKGLRSRYEAHHEITITDSAIEAAAKLSARYVNDRFLPDKAIDLIDEAGARMRIATMTAPKEVKELEEKLQQKSTELEIALKDENFSAADELKAERDDLQKAVDKAREKWLEDKKLNIPQITDEDIAKILEMSTGIPVYKMTEAETKRLLNMEDELHKRIIGQDEAIKALSKSIRRTRAGLKDPKRPSGSFIFAGPTGVGKTEMAQALAEFLFGDENSLIQIDMSEYGEKHTTSRLFGAPPGFVGYDDGGQLTEKVRRKPFSVVLFDEIEKAHPDIFNTLLQVLEDGHLTDSSGRMIDFKNTVIIMTTNLGSKDVNRGISVGFNDETDNVASYEQMQKKVREDLKKEFRPEFLNRLDDIIVFPQLKKAEVLQIVDLMLSSLQKRLDEKSIKLELTATAKELLVTKGYDPVLGARPLRRVITRELEDELSEKILFGDIKDGATVKVDADKATEDGKFSFDVK